jgi:hypothetical protein
VIEVYDMEAFLKAGEYCNLMDKEIGTLTESDRRDSAKMFIKQIQSSGFQISVVLRNDSRDHSYTLLPNGKLDVTEGKLDLVNGLIREVATETMCGNFTIRQNIDIGGALGKGKK